MPPPNRRDWDAGEVPDELDARESPMKRWLRRKQLAAQEATAPPEAGEPAGEESAVLSDSDMPPLQSLTAESDFSVFLSPGVSDRLRRLALRKLFGMQKFNLRDGLDDYDDDYTLLQPMGKAVAREMLRKSRQSEQTRSPAQQVQAPETEMPAPSSESGNGDTAMQPPSEVVTQPVETAVSDDQPSLQETVETFETVSTPLPARTGNGRARHQALAAHQDKPGTAVDYVEYRSRGNLVILGARDQALACAEALIPALRCVLVLDPDEQPAFEERANGITLTPGRDVTIEGHMGAFSVSVEAPDRQRYNPAALFGADIDAVDLILDLGDPPRVSSDLPPPGYYAPPAEEIPAVLAELPERVGEFLKPRYFDYDASICAHGRSGQPGCRRCLDACPTLAIQSIGDSVAVDPFLCQGGGSCATACPTGAIRYTYPEVTQLLGGVRDALVRYRAAGGEDPQVVFFDSQTGQQAMAEYAEQLPESVLPFQVEEVGSVGLDAWLATLAYGARRVVLFSTQAVPRSVLTELSRQFNYAGAILDGMGYRRDCLRWVFGASDPGSLVAVFQEDVPDTEVPPATFESFTQKRTNLWLAIDHLYRHARDPQPVTTLPDEAPFGGIEVDARSCTLCMSCVAVCPSRALYDGNDRPALRFVEANCVQCGLCHQACPEAAIQLVPRLDYRHYLERGMRTLHEEEPFCCVVCGKPFATRSVMDRMTERLAEHWMFRDEQALRRIQMCGDCRVVDAFNAGVQDRVYDGQPRG